MDNLTCTSPFPMLLYLYPIFIEKGASFMAFHITTPEFSQTIQQALDTLHPNCDPEKPNLHLCPRLVSCDGPSLSVEL